MEKNYQNDFGFKELSKEKMEEFIKLLSELDDDFSELEFTEDKNSIWNFDPDYKLLPFFKSGRDYDLFLIYHLQEVPELSFLPTFFETPDLSDSEIDLPPHDPRLKFGVYFESEFELLDFLVLLNSFWELKNKEFDIENVKDQRQFLKRINRRAKLQNLPRIDKADVEGHLLDY